MSIKQYKVPNTECIKNEFADVLDKDATLVCKFNTASHFTNSSKNRYSDVMANDASRVPLKMSSGFEGYINANYVFDEYIATQAPLGKSDRRSTETLIDFWLMIWQQRSPIIVMLTRLIENKQRKAERYWPEHDSQMKFGDITVRNTKVTKLDTIIITRLELQHNDETRVIHHLHYKDWPDKGTPVSTDNLRALISLVNFFKGFVSKLDGRIVCHCSAGIGRTGSFIAAHYIISSLDSGIESVDVSDVVKEMRSYRSGTVQTVEQYEFIYRVVNDWITQRVIQLPSKKRRLSKTRSLCVLPSYLVTGGYTVDERDMLTSSHGCFQDTPVSANV